MKKRTHQILKKESPEVTLSIDIHGTFPSLNSWYAGKHWTSRHKTKQEIQRMFMLNIAGKPGIKFLQFRVHYRYHNRYDCDNTIPAIKILVDTLKEMGIIIDDTPKYFLGLSIEYDKKLIYNQHIFEIIGI